MKEIKLSLSKPIVSRSDLSGKIIYVNEEFIKITGFSREEVIGRPHNIVRHKDMPKECFADLWREIKKGNVWRGIVKNKTKNGDFYWVNALISPIRENGVIKGYESVRTAPTQEAINEAEENYKKIKAGKKFSRKKEIFDFDYFQRILCMMAFINFGILMNAVFFQRKENWILLGLCVFLSFVYVIWEKYFIVDPMKMIDDKIKKMSQGDLALQMFEKGQGEFKNIVEAVELIRVALIGIESEVDFEMKDLMDLTRKGHHEIEKTNMILNEQKKHEGNLTKANNELKKIIEEIEKISAKTKNSALRNMEVNEYNQRKVEQEVAHLEDIKEEINHVKNQMEGLKENIQKASNFIEVINEIAKQTNFLAINAAIEAAKSGALGRGFVTVSEEVKKLSGKTEQMAESIGEVFGAMNISAKKTEESIMKIEEIEKQIREESEEVAEKVKESFILTKETKRNSESAEKAIEKQKEDYEKITKLIEKLKMEDSKLIGSGKSMDENFEKIKNKIEQIQKIQGRFNFKVKD